jgi:dTDP-3-amino-3,4,6-trideoxy-alpha-D-glucose transaminase
MGCEAPAGQQPEVEVPLLAPSTVVEGPRESVERRSKRGYSRVMNARSVAIPGVAVPFLDLTPSTKVVQRPVFDELEAVSDANAFINGPQVDRFERAFADYCGTEHCVGLASGLDALRLGLLAAALERGDEVLVPANTFIATFEAITQAGGVPVPVDVTETDYNLDVDAAVAAIGERTRYVMPVHLYGQLTDLRRLGDELGRRGIAILEDACQAHGASRDGLRSGTVGVASAFSFYPGKNLGAIGDAGALVTNDPELAETVVALREHGQRRKYHHELEGYTARLDTIQALALLHKLPHLDGWTAERRAIAARYTAELAGVGDLRVPPVPPGSEPVWHLYELRTGSPERLAEFLAERGIGTGRHYPQCAHLSPAYGSLGYRPGAFPVAETLAEELISLPMFPGMTEAQRDAVVAGVRDFFAGGE